MHNVHANWDPANNWITLGGGGVECKHVNKMSRQQVKGEVPDLTSRLMTFEKTISCVVEVASYTEAAEA